MKSILFMMPFAFFLIVLGIIFILWGNSFFDKILIQKEENDKTPGRNPQRPRKLKKEKTPKEIRKKIFNKKYPERLKAPEEDLIILREREINPPPPPELSTQKEDLTGFQNEEEETAPSPSRLPKIEIIEDIEEVEKPMKQIHGNMYIDTSKVLPLGENNLKETDWEDNQFTHFRRIGSATLLENNEYFEFRQKNLLYKIPIEEIEKIVFYDKGMCVIPLKNEVPNILFLSKESFKIKEFLSSDINLI